MVVILKKKQKICPHLAGRLEKQLEPKSVEIRGCFSLNQKTKDRNRQFHKPNQVAVCVAKTLATGGC